MRKIFVAGLLLLLLFTGTAFVQAYNLPKSVMRGQELYATYCQNCHMQDGKGQAGVFPPLAKADYLKKTPVSKIIDIILKGQTGEINVNGSQYNAQMLALDYLSDEQVADILNYTYNSWGNKSLKAVTPAQVKKRDNNTCIFPMKEIKDIVHAFDEATRLQQKTALATVVHVSGSSYRRPGARMLVTEDGQLTGAISGGCLEGDALRKAVLAITQGKNKLVIYDTTDEDDAKLGVQLGCNGIVSILFEPIDADQANHPIQLLRSVIAERKPALLVTGYSLNQHTHLGTTALTDLPAVVSSHIQSTAATVLAEQVSIHIDLSIEANQQHFFVEYCKPSIALVVVGAGNDALPLVNMAHVLGWEITVVDGRATHATTQRLLLADTIIVAKPKEAAERLQTDERTALVLMTHNYNYDLEMLQQLPATNIAYIGMLGPATKRNRMLDELAQQGIVFADSFLKKIYGPTGIDLGAETAAEIALSITAEIMSVLQDTQPVHLREKQQAIHHRAV